MVDHPQHKLAPVDLVEVQLESEVRLGVSGEHLPNGCSFIGISKDTIEEIANFGMPFLGLELFGQDDVLHCLTEKSLAGTSSHLAHDESLLKSRLQILVNVAEVSKVDSFFVEALAELTRVEEVSIEGVHLHDEI